ncbi:hypothetical protein [Alkaliphilus sp. B6464]|uniref:hypothetical protein n=1 Tax=Alkaliphilus sp. B6464 TaxID=2731219 RepID=UPI001BAC896F|nr:hypothetical protein [Alkaliphilus sp. B6464]QUH22003.1 hypothetical protein HYG84_19045 [Alkaliphilus sp. B6464]
MGNKILSLFQDTSKVINFHYFSVEFKTLLVICSAILSITVFFFLFNLINQVMIENKLRKKNITISRKRKNRYFFINKIIDSFNNESLNMKFIHSGYVLGIKTVELYVFYRGLFTLAGFILGIQLFNVNNLNYSILVTIMTTMLGFLLTDFLLELGKKKRVRSIKDELPLFLSSFDNYTKAGLVFEDILDTIPKLLKGDLQEEVVRFNVSYSLSKDFEGTVKEFIDRLGFPESEELEIKMRQCYYSGIYDDVLTNEKEMIEKKVINELRKETEMFDLYLGIAMGLMVVNIFIIVILPLLNLASSGVSDIFKM